MAFNSEEPRVEYTANEGQTIYTFLFKIYNETNLVVYNTDMGELPNDETDKLTLTSDYEVLIDGDNGGSITLTSASTLGDKLTILRELPQTRDVEYQTSGDLLADTLNDDQDYQTYLIADVLASQSRNITLSQNSQGVSNVLPSPSPDQYLRWSDDASQLINDSTIPTAVQDAADSAAAAKLSEDAAKLSEDNAAQSAQDSADSAQDAAQSATDATTNGQLEAWKAEAEKMTADSYATEAEDVVVKTYASNGDGTFTATSTTEYSALHWAAKSEQSSGVAPTTTPILSGNAIVNENDFLIVTITNYDQFSPNATFVNITTNGTASRVGDTITITTTDVIADEPNTLTVTAQEPSHEVSTSAVHNFTVIDVPIIEDQSLIYDNTNIGVAFDTLANMSVFGNVLTATSIDTTSIIAEDTLDLVPAMTSATTPSGEVTASAYQATLDPYYAFDNAPASPNYWQIDGFSSGWIQYKFESSRAVNKYTLTCPATLATRMAKDWNVVGSNTGAFTGEQVLLDTVVNQTGWGTEEKREFQFSNTDQYLYYRINIVANNGDAKMGISEIEFMTAGANNDEFTTPIEVINGDTINVDGTDMVAAGVNEVTELVPNEWNTDISLWSSVEPDWTADGTFNKVTEANTRNKTLVTYDLNNNVLFITVEVSAINTTMEVQYRRTSDLAYVTVGTISSTGTHTFRLDATGITSSHPYIYLYSVSTFSVSEFSVREYCTVPTTSVTAGATPYAAYINEHRALSVDVVQDGGETDFVGLKSSTGAGRPFRSQQTFTNVSNLSTINTLYAKDLKDGDNLIIVKNDNSLNEVTASGVVAPVQLLTNGGFDTDTDWTKSGNAVIAGGVVTMSDLGGAVYVDQIITTEIGRRYAITVEVLAVTDRAFIGIDEAEGLFGVAYKELELGFNTIEFTSNAISLHACLRIYAGAALTADNYSIKSYSKLDTTATTAGEIPSRAFSIGSQPSFKFGGGFEETVISNDQYVNEEGYLSFDAVAYTGNGTSKSIVTNINSCDFTVPSNGSGFWFNRDKFEVVDESKPELVVNGTFDTNIDNWTIAIGAISNDTQRMKITNTTASAGYAYQGIPTVVGKSYAVSAEVINGTSTTGRILVGGIGGGHLFTSSQGGGVKTSTFIADSTTTYINTDVVNGTSGVYCFFDNISLIEIPVEGTADWLSYNETSGETPRGVAKIHIKSRSSVASNYVFDGIRGADIYVRTDTTDAETTGSTQFLTSYNADGFTVANNGLINGNTETFISYTTLYTSIKWGVTNQGKKYVEAYNRDTKETMIMYEGSGLVGHSIPQSTGAALEYSDTKGLEGVGSVDNWSSVVYSISKMRSINSTNPITDASVYSSSGTELSISSGHTQYNGSGVNYILYGKAKSTTWTIVEYTGTGAAGNFVETTDVGGVARRPRRVIHKGVADVSDWGMYDSERDISGVLFLDLSNTEDTVSYSLSVSDTGFTPSDTTSGAAYNNVSGREYIALVEFDTDNASTGSFTPDGLSTTRTYETIVSASPSQTLRTKMSLKAVGDNTTLLEAELTKGE